MKTRIELEGKHPFEISKLLEVGDRLVFRSGVVGTYPRIITRKITGFAAYTIDGNPQVTHNGPRYAVRWHEIKAVIKEQD